MQHPLLFSKAGLGVLEGFAVAGLGGASSRQGEPS